MSNRGYAVTQRLRLIDFLVHQYGYVNRSALMDYFGISTPQASADIKSYIELAPRNLIYDGKAKAYRAGPAFRRVWL